MELSKKIEMFKQDLKDNTKNSSIFNVWAFIFSSFYFFYIDMIWYFLLFILLPYIIMLPFVTFLGIGIAFALAFAIAHLIAGFVANPLYKKYKKKFIELHENADTSRPVEYFAISLKRLIFLTLLSGGLYTIYWGFRNWKAYQQTTHDSVNPYIRAWFFNLTIINLAQKMKLTFKPKKWFTIYGVLCFLVFAAQIIIVLVGGKFASDAISAWTIMGIIILLAIAYPLCLVPLQLKINQYNAKKFKKEREKRFYPWEMFFVGLGILINWIIPLYEAQNSLSFAQWSKAGASVGFIYRHTKAYSAVCQKEGYQLKNYPDNFKTYFAEDIKNLDEVLAKYDTSINEIEKTEITPEIRADAERAVYVELNDLRKFWIVSIIASQTNTPADEIIWQDEMYNLMPFKDMCEIFDNIGIELLKSGENANFLKLNALNQN